MSTAKDKRTVVKPPKWGFFNIPKDAVIEVGPRRPIYGDTPLKPGDDAARDVYLDGVKVGYVAQSSHTSSVKMGRLRRDTGHPTPWILNGRDYWDDFSQMNDAVYHLVERWRLSSRAKGQS